MRRVKCVHSMPRSFIKARSKTAFIDTNSIKTFQYRYMQSKETGTKYTNMPTAVLSYSSSVGGFRSLLYTFMDLNFV